MLTFLIAHELLDIFFLQRSTFLWICTKIFVMGLLVIVRSLRQQIDGVGMCNNVLHFKAVASWMQSNNDFKGTLLPEKSRKETGNQVSHLLLGRLRQGQSDIDLVYLAKIKLPNNGEKKSLKANNMHVNKIYKFRN